MGRKPAAAALLALALAQPGLAAALRPAGEQAKIDFLIGEVKKSDDVFIRNGKEYSGSRAASHLAMKLRFAGKRIQTAMEFVLGVASKSGESGKLYEVRTREGHREPLRDWLLARLQLHEKTHPGSPTPAVTPAAIPLAAGRSPVEKPAPPVEQIESPDLDDVIEVVVRELLT